MFLSVIYSLVLLTGVILGALILLRKGDSGGISDMFGGGIAQSAHSSSVANRNLNRATVAVGAIWVALIVAAGLVAGVGA